MGTNTHISVNVLTVLDSILKYLEKAKAPMLFVVTLELAIDRIGQVLNDMNNMSYNLDSLRTENDALRKEITTLRATLTHLNNPDLKATVAMTVANRLAHYTETYTTTQIEEVTRLLMAREKINAIKAFRQATGTGLRESKDEIENLSAMHNLY